MLPGGMLPKGVTVSTVCVNLNNDYVMSVGKVSGCCVKQNSQRQCSVEHDGRVIQQRHCIIRSCHKLQAAKALPVTCSNIGIIKLSIVQDIIWRMQTRHYTH